MALSFGYSNVDWNNLLKGTGVKPYDPRPRTPFGQWPWLEPDDNPLKRFTDYKEIRELVKKQEKEIEHLRETISSLLDIIKNMSKDNKQP